MNGKTDTMDVLCLSVAHRVLLSAISQMVIPRARMSNIPTFLEIFYCWCILRGLSLNIPYILLSQMKMALVNKKIELPYGVVLTVREHQLYVKITHKVILLLL